MKHLLIILVAFSSIAIATENNLWDDIIAKFYPREITLDTKFITADKKTSSLYTHPEKASKSSQITSPWGTESSLTFYIDINQMLGGKKLRKGQRYQLNSLSWHCHPKGDFTGGGRRVIISNGENAMIRPLPETKNEKLTIHQKGENNDFTFASEDILEVTITWKGAQHQGCSVRCYDAPAAPAAIRGTAFNLTPAGTLPEGNGVDNKYNKRWRFNCPAVRIRATSVPEYDFKSIALICLTVILILLLIKRIKGTKKES